MIYYYVCELNSTVRSDVPIGPDCRVFVFNLSLSKLDHDGELIVESLKENVKFIAEGPVYHF